MLHKRKIQKPSSYICALPVSHRLEKLYRPVDSKCRRYVKNLMEPTLFLMNNNPATDDLSNKPLLFL
jgi:hypothetical protein